MVVTVTTVTYKVAPMVNCTKMRLAAGLRPDLLRSYGAPHTLAVIKGAKEGRGRKESVSYTHLTLPTKRIV